MADSTIKSELVNTWESAAPGWAKWEHVFTASLHDTTNTLIDMAGIQSGMHVLDLACGTGSQSIQVAKHVGPTGRIVACDISGRMLEHVRQNADRAGLSNIETFESAADELDAMQARFDAAICRLGLMLFPSPQEALQSVWHALKPGARFAALVFATPAKNPFMAQPMAILLRHASKPPPGPEQPGIFALGGDGVLERLIQDGGFVDVKTQAAQAALFLPNASDALHLLQEAAGAYRAVVAELDDAGKSKAWDEVYECLKQFETADGFATKLDLIIGKGARPG